MVVSLTYGQTKAIYLHYQAPSAFLNLVQQVPESEAFRRKIAPGYLAGCRRALGVMKMEGGHWRMLVEKEGNYLGERK